jgi:hypothetical protein
MKGMHTKNIFSVYGVRKISSQPAKIINHLWGLNQSYMCVVSSHMNASCNNHIYEREIVTSSILVAQYQRDWPPELQYVKCVTWDSVISKGTKTNCTHNVQLSAGMYSVICHICANWGTDVMTPLFQFWFMESVWLIKNSNRHFKAPFDTVLLCKKKCNTVDD